MASAFTPGLRITRSTRVRRWRSLPVAGEVMVKIGQQVQADEVVARAMRPGGVAMRSLAHELGLDPRQVEAHLCCQVGDSVHEDQVIARRTGLFGWSERSVRSPFKGTLESLSLATGQAIFRRPPEAQRVRAHLTGTITRIEAGKAAEVECHGALMQGIFGLGGEARGELLCPSSHDLEEVDWGLDHPGKMLAVRGSASARALRTAIEHGVRAVICGAMDSSELQQFHPTALGSPMTGEESLGLTLILTEGFGPLTMAERCWQLLCELEGSQASVNGATQIRAGVVRPEVIVTHTDGRPLKDDVQPNQHSSLTLGCRVRLIREPGFGQIAQVRELPSQPAAIATGAVLRVVRVQLADSTEQVVPRANVELVEG